MLLFLVSCGFIDTLFSALLGIGNMIGTGGENKVALVSIGRDIWLSIKRYRRFFAIWRYRIQGGRVLHKSEGYF